MPEEMTAADWATLAVALDLAAAKVDSPAAETPTQAGVTMLGTMATLSDKVSRELDGLARRQPIGDLSIYAGYPHVAEYIARLHAAPAGVLAQYATPVCPECARVIAGDGVVMGDEDVHYVLAGCVVVGCEDYFTVNPAAVGLDGSKWEDWRQSEGWDD